MILRILIFLFSLYVIYVNPDGKQKGSFVKDKFPMQAKNVSRKVGPEWGYCLQKLDHFNPNATKKWIMRFLSNREFFKGRGPIFVMIGGESAISKGWLRSGQMYDIAKEHGAWMFFTEHRYYGHSQPTENLSTENLKYLSASQAIQDVVEFIKLVKSSYKPLNNKKVIVFGGSYGGNLATWIRLKYPYVVYAAVASSAPILAKADFYEYMEMIAKILDLIYPGCTEVIKNATKVAEQFLKNGFEKNGISQVQKDFGLCSPVNIDNIYELGFFFSTIASIFTEIVQNRPDEIYASCHEISYKTKFPYQRVSDFVRTRATNTSIGCLLNYKEKIEWLKNTDYQSDEMRQWIYQSCNEFGYFQTSNSKHQPFGNKFPISMDFKKCQDIFGPKFTSNFIREQINRTNRKFGGLKPQNLSRVIFINGKLDPWHRLGLQRDLNPSCTVIFHDSSHFMDMNSLSNKDSPLLRETKLRVQDQVRKWVRSRHEKY